MRCRRARALLQLSRDGELSPSVREQVLRHAAGCVGCGAELERIRRTDAAIRSIRMVSPVLPDPEGFTREIMQRAGADRGFARARRPDGIRWTLSRPRFHSSLRLVAAALVVAFVAQNTIDGDRMSRHDRRLSQIPVTGGAESPVTIPLPASAAALLGAIPEEDVLAGMLRLIRGDRGGSSTMMELLRTKYPGLFSITADDGLDQREQAILASEGRAFVLEVEHYVKLAERNHARN